MKMIKTTPDGLNVDLDAVDLNYVYSGGLLSYMWFATAGNTYRKYYAYDGSGQITSRTQWVKQ